MPVRYKLLIGEEGLILLSTLLILSLLLAAGVGSRVMLQNEYKIAGNLRGSTEAFYIAEAGVAWSKEEIRKTIVHPPNPASATRNYGSGTFVVSFPSTTAVTPLSARIVVSSRGAVGKSAQVVQAQITKSYDLADSAVGLRGNVNRVGFNGNSFLITGKDHDPETAATIGQSKARPAISVSDSAQRDLVEQALVDIQAPARVESGGGIPAIAQSSHVPALAVTRWADELCNSAQALKTVVPADGVLSVAGQAWGSRTSPELRCIEGLAGPGDSVNFVGSLNGAGILVVRNADLIVSGSLNWEGLMIISGSNVSFKAVGADNKEIYGALVINETGTPGSGTVTLDIQGSIKLLFSRAALGRTAALIPSATLDNMYTALPSTIRQDYWRSLGP